MVKPQVVPRIVIIGLAVMILGAILATVSYVYEMSIIRSTTGHPLFDLFADGFKVGLGAFIGVLSQWASRVFANAEAAEKESQQETSKDKLATPKPAEPAKSTNSTKRANLKNGKIEQIQRKQP